MAMTRRFGDVPPLTSNVGIESNGQSVQFPEGTIEILASKHQSLDPFGVQTIYVLPETEQLHLIRYMETKDRHHGTILVRLYDTDDQQQGLVGAVNEILKSQGEVNRIPAWAK